MKKIKMKKSITKINPFPKIKKITKKNYNTIKYAIMGVPIPFLTNNELLHYSKKITESAPTVYDKILDQNYNDTHIGGGNHRMFDGGHDVYNAWVKINDANPADSFLTRRIGYSHALWKDVTTPKGLPLVTWNKQSYERTATWATKYIPGMTKTRFYDYMSFDIFDIIGSGVAIVSYGYYANKNDHEKVNEIIGNIAVTSILSANPLMALSLFGIIPHAIFYKNIKLKPVILLKSAGLSLVSIAAFTALRAPLLIRSGVSILATMLIKYGVLENKSLGRYIDNSNFILKIKHNTKLLSKKLPKKEWEDVPDAIIVDEELLKKNKNMGFFSNIVSATIKIALAPVAVVKDVVDVAIGGDADNTKKLIESAKDDAKDAVDDLTEGEL